MIPAEYVSRPAFTQLVDWVRNEIPRALAERRPLEEKWVKYQRMYRAQPEEEIRTFPFHGAANFVVPIVATDVDVIFSRLMGILFSPDNLWTMRPLRPDMVTFAPRLEELMKWAQHRELDAYNAVADFLLEVCKLGTGVLKQRYKRDQRRVYNFRETPQGTLEDFAAYVVNEHPVLAHTSLYDFLVPPSATSIQEAAWASERVMLSWSQYQNRVRNGVYVNQERLQSWFANDRGSWVEEAHMQLDRFVPGLGTRFEFWETWLDFDITGSGEPMALVLTMHLPSVTPVRLDFNPFFHQEKPYSFARFMRQEKRFYGIGLAEMLEMSQEEITAMHRQRIDNGTLQNSVMMKAKRGIGIREDEPIFPGRWFILDDLNDVQPMSMGGSFDMSLNNEQATLGYAKERTGVNDYLMGNPTPAIGYGTATVNTFQHQEAARRVDQTLREVRFALSESGTRIVELYQQFNQAGKIYEVMGEKDAEVVLQFLQFPLELIRFGVGIDVTATSAALSKENEIRTNMVVMQLVAQFYQQMLEGMQLVLNPGLPMEMRAMVVQMMHAGNVLMRRILDSHGLQDVDELIPELQELLNGQQQQIGAVQAGLQQPLGGGAGMAPPVDPASGMGALPPGVPGGNGAGAAQLAGI